MAFEYITINTVADYLTAVKECSKVCVVVKLRTEEGQEAGDSYINTTKREAKKLIKLGSSDVLPVDAFMRGTTLFIG